MLIYQKSGFIKVGLRHFLDFVAWIPFGWWITRKDRALSISIKHVQHWFIVHFILFYHQNTF